MYRIFYTVQSKNILYILHHFQKKIDIMILQNLKNQFHK
ncbi:MULTISPECIES: type II toxin-antitoxin system RelE/ParE family toxin [unclassified Bartonella]